MKGDINPVTAFSAASMFPLRARRTAIHDGPSIVDEYVLIFCCDRGSLINPVHGELPFTQRLAVQTIRGNGFASGNSQDRLSGVLGDPFCPRGLSPDSP
jgi:hypothetical protein